jgi:hypothetical protein
MNRYATPSYSRLMVLSALVFMCGALLSPSLIHAANEKELIIWPDQFLAQRQYQADRQNSAFVTSTLPPLSGPPYSNVSFHVPVDLARAREILGLTYYHSGSGEFAATTVNLFARVIDEPGTLILSGSSNEDTNGAVVPVEAGFFGNFSQFDANHRYFLEIHVDNNQAAVWGVRLQYR